MNKHRTQGEEQRLSSVLQGWDQESQGASGAEFGKVCKEQEEGLLQDFQSEKEDQRRCTHLINLTGKLSEEKAEVLNNFFYLGLYQQHLFPHLLSRWATGWELGKQSPSHCERFVTS